MGFYYHPSKIKAVKPWKKKDSVEEFEKQNSKEEFESLVEDRIFDMQRKILSQNTQKKLKASLKSLKPDEKLLKSKNFFDEHEEEINNSNDCIVHFDSGFNENLNRTKPKIFDSLILNNAKPSRNKIQKKSRNTHIRKNFFSKVNKKKENVFFL